MCLYQHIIVAVHNNAAKHPRNFIYGSRIWSQQGGWLGSSADLPQLAPMPGVRLAIG